MSENHFPKIILEKTCNKKGPNVPEIPIPNFNCLKKYKHIKFQKPTLETL